MTIRKRHILFVIGCWLPLVLCLTSCQKDLKLKYGIGAIKQVVIANLYPGVPLQVNISKSKQPDDYGSVEFLSDCKVDLYENDEYRETLTFHLKDTLSGLGYYVSTLILTPNRTYKIISTHSTLGTVEASEYLPPVPSANVSLLQHADSTRPSMTGKYTVTITDSAGWKNYYYIIAYYRILRPVIKSNGDTVYRYDYLFDVPSYTPEIPNPGDYNRQFTTDEKFDGQVKTFVFDFPSSYNAVYKEILFIVEVSGMGPNYYNWNLQQIPLGNTLNDGQEERTNLKSNILNGYGHFTANSSYYMGFPIK